MPGPLQDQLKQPAPFRSAEAEAFLNVLRTSAQLVGGLLEVLRPHALTRLLDRMAERGLVARERSPADRRVVTARITPAGRALTDALDAPVEAMHARQLGHLTPDELRALNALLVQARNEGGASRAG